MGAPDPTGFIRQLYDSKGVPIGVDIAGYCRCAQVGGGLILIDSAGVNWLFTVGTDGRLNVQGVTF